MIRYNFHTHSQFDDGKEPPENYILSAIEKGFAALGFSAHVPLPIKNEWHLPADKFPGYVSEIRKLKEQYKAQISLYLGLEIDYIPGVSADFEAWSKTTPLDYCIGSVHLVAGPQPQQLWFIDGPADGFFRGVEEVFAGDIRKAVTAFYQQSTAMVNTQPMQIIGHMDKVKMHNKERLFSQEEPWYIEQIDRLLRAIKEKDVIVELNTRGVYTGKSKEYFPSTFVLERCLHYGIQVMVSTDAHHPTQIDSHFDQGVALLKNIGFKKLVTPFFETEI